MRVAIVDMGTNSVRMDIYEIHADGAHERLYRAKIMVRLGQGVFINRELHQEAIERTLAALRRYQKACIKHETTEIVAVGTSALREAKNAQAFLQRLREETGFDVKVISGTEEAQLILRGLLQDTSLHQGVVGFIDIGGGSTEVGVCQEGQVIFLESLELGAARLNQLFLANGSNDSSIAEVRKYIQQELMKFTRLASVPPFRRAMGSSGTVRAILNLLEASGRGSHIRLQYLRELNETLVRLTPEGLLDVPGMNPNRIDIIVSGGLILEEVMSYLKLEVVEYTDYALRDGLLAEVIESKFKNAA